MGRVSADERRHELVAAAIRVMARDGVAKTSTRAIATEADMPVGFFHYCFRSKQELFLHVIGTINDRNREAAKGVVEPHRTIADTVRASLRAYWQLVQDNPGEHQVTYELTQYALRSPDLADVARVQYEGYIEAATDFLEAAATACAVEWTVSVRILARYVHTVLDGVTLAWIVDRNSAEALAVLDEFAADLAKSARLRRAS
jgi:AcrR family transcriptional regulator